MKVKVCGITSKEDALMAANTDINAIGVINVEDTSRFVNLDDARGIFNAVPIFLTKVIVITFAEDRLNKIKLRELEATGANCLQLHGEEKVELVKSLKKETKMSIIKKIAVDENSVEKALYYEKCVDAILLDTKIADFAGGTGKTHDWNISLRVRKRVKKPVILAGGLTPENVAEAIKFVKPYAVDVSSGVEREVRKKDETKIREFLNAAKMAEIKMQKEDRH